MLIIEKIALTLKKLGNRLTESKGFRTIRDNLRRRITPVFEKIDPLITRAAPWLETTAAILGGLLYYSIKFAVILVLLILFPFRFVLFLFSLLFGSLRYRSPHWVGVLRNGFVYLISLPLEALETLSRNRRPYYNLIKISAILLLLLFGGLKLQSWFQPESRKATFLVQAPGVPDLRRNEQPQALKVRFSASVAPLRQIGQELSRGINLEPAHAGVWHWESDRVLVFSPAADWPIGQEYSIQFDPSIFSPEADLETYDCEFKTPAFTVAIQSLEYYIDPENPETKKAVAVLKFNYPVDVESLKSRVSLAPAGALMGGGDKYPLEVHLNDYRDEAHIHSKVIPIPPKDLELRFQVDSGVMSERGGAPADDGAEKDLVIASINNHFQILSSSLTQARNRSYELEQILVLETRGNARAEDFNKKMAVYEMPADREADSGLPPSKNHRWSREEIGPAHLKAARKLKITPVETEREFGTTHSFRYQATPGRYLFVRIDKGTVAYTGYRTADVFDSVHRIEPFPREIKIMHEGALLSLKGERKISLLAHDVEAVRVIVSRVLPGEINHLVSQTSGHFKSPYFENYSFNESNLTEQFTKIIQLQKSERGRMQYFSFDFTGYLKRTGNASGLFFLKVQAWNPARRRPIDDVSDRRFILVSDLGFLVKESAGGERDLFVQSISGGYPVSGVMVNVLGRNGQSIASSLTDPDGHVAFPSLKDFKQEKEPTAYVLRLFEDISFMPFNRSDRRLNLSNFDIGGVRTPRDRRGLSAQLFSDRGLYRPGEEWNIGLILRDKAWGSLPAGLPLELVIRDPRGLEIHKKKFRLQASGFHELKYSTTEHAPTGAYDISLYTRKDKKRDTMLGRTGVKVDEFLPDRLRITARLLGAKNRGWIYPHDLKGQIHLSYLFGMPAADHRISGEITLSPQSLRFQAHPDFKFFEPEGVHRDVREPLAGRNTDRQGNVEFPLNLERFDRSVYRLTLNVAGHESGGGRSVATSVGALVSSNKYLIGYKPDGPLGYIRRNVPRSVRWIAVDPDLKKIAVSGLTVRLVEERRVSALIRDPGGAFRYRSIKKEIKVHDKKLSISAAGSNYDLKTDRPGDYLITVNDGQGREIQKLRYSVAGRANLAGLSEKKAELQVKLNQTDYRPGDMIEVAIRAPYTGSGLITIERDKVYAHKWFRSPASSSIQTIRVPDNLEGNAYVNVSFIRAPDSIEIYRTPLSYGVAPFSISRERRQNKITLRLPSTMRPGRPLRIQYRTTQPGRILIFAVDEGILQAAGYRTPDPLAYFFRKRALQTTTMQILDLILPEYSLVRSLSAEGGGADDEAIQRSLNPFKGKRRQPVVFWSGIKSSDSGFRTMVYNIPDHFNGSLRVMAIAVTPDRIGSIASLVAVRDRLIISPAVPAFVAPGDEFELTAGVINNVPKSGAEARVRLELQTSNHLKLLGPQPTLKIPEGTEKTFRFKLRALTEPGAAWLELKAGANGASSKIRSELSVRPASPYRVTVHGGTLRSGSTRIQLRRQLHSQYRRSEFYSSGLPLVLAGGLGRYLEAIPYGCTEQLVSRSIPALVLADRPEIFDAGPTQNKKNAAFRPMDIEKVLNVLRVRQNAEGAFGFWAANSHVSPYQSVYAMHFLTEARSRGVSVSPDMRNRGLNYLRNLAADDDKLDLPLLRARAYAAYILTRNNIVAARQVASIRSSLEDHSDWKQDLACLYLAAAYRLLKLNRQAESLINAVDIKKPSAVNYHYFYDDVLRNAQYLYILARHFPERLRRMDKDLLVHLLKPILENRVNTLTAANTILALDAIAGTLQSDQKTLVRIHEILKSGQSRPLSTSGRTYIRAGFSPEAKALKVINSGNFLLFYQALEAGYDRTPPQKSIRKGLELIREYRSTDEDEITEARIGTEIEVLLRMRSLEEGHISNVAIVDLLPGGFEPVLEGMPDRNRRAVGSGDDPSSTGAKSTFKPDFVDVREDRLILYGRVTPDVREYRYRIRAVNCGTYSIPPAFAHSMYNPKIQALAPSAEKMRVFD